MDFATDSVGGTYSNASGTVALNAVTIGVRKIKPSGFARDVSPAFESGADEAVANVVGPKKRENLTVSVSLRVWQVFIAANPDYGAANKFWTISVSYKLPTGESCPIDHSQANLVKETPSEADFATAGEALIDLEFAPIRATIANVAA